MGMRSLGPAAGWKWLMFGINLGRGNPRAIFGGAALLVLAVLALAIVLSIALGAIQASAGGGGDLWLSLVITVPLMVAMGGMMVGYLRVIDAVEHGRPATAGAVFAGFRDRGAWLNASGLLLMLAVIQNLAIYGLVTWLAPDVVSWYMENLAAAGAEVPAETMELPTGFGRAMAVASVIGLLVFAVQAIGLGQVALRGRGALGALGDGAQGALRSMLPLVVLLFLALAVLLVFSLVAAVIALLFAAIAGAAGAAGAVLAAVVGIPLYLLAMLAVFVVMMGVMYAVWRDIAGNGGAPSAEDHTVAA